MVDEHDATHVTQSSIRTTHRMDRSIPMYLLQSLLKPFKPRLIESSKEYPGLSTKLTAPKGVSSKCEVQERKVAELWVYDIQRKGIAGQKETASTSGADIRVIYYAGGGFQLPASSQHWKLLADLVCNKGHSSMTVSLISYPLAPDNSAKDAFERTVLCTEETIAAARANGEKVILMGDSAGGNLAAAIVIDLLKKHTSQEESRLSDPSAKSSSHLPLPNATILISPSLDLTRSNPQIEKIALYDPLFTAEAAHSTAAARLWGGMPKSQGKYASNPPSKELSINSHHKVDDAVPSQLDFDDWTPLDPRISPVYTPSPLLSKLATHNIAMHGIVGTYDVLSADALIFRDRCAAAGVRGEWLVWEKQMHCFPIVKGYFSFAEVEGASEWIADVVRREVEGK